MGRPAFTDEGFCDECSEPIPQSEISVEAFEVSGRLICTACLEQMAEGAVTL